MPYSKIKPVTFEGCNAIHVPSATAGFGWFGLFNPFGGGNSARHGNVRRRNFGVLAAV